MVRPGGRKQGRELCARRSDWGQKVRRRVSKLRWKNGIEAGPRSAGVKRGGLSAEHQRDAQRWDGLACKKQNPKKRNKTQKG